MAGSPARRSRSGRPDAPGLSPKVFRVGAERQVTRGEKTMEGVPVSRVRSLGAVRAGTRVELTIGDWPSGLYFAKADRSPPRRLCAVRGPAAAAGEHDVAVVLPTRTWQAYNFRDDDRDGRADTWYAPRGGDVVRLGRPFLNRGVPPHFAQYDLRFLRWLHATGRRVDVLAQEDLDEADGPASQPRTHCWSSPATTST